MFAYTSPGHLHREIEESYNNVSPAQCEVVSSQPQSADSPLVSRPVLIMLRISSCTPYLRAVSSIRNPKSHQAVVEAVRNVKAQGDTWEGEWRGNRRLERVATTLAMCLGSWSIHGRPADPHSSTASSRLNWLPRRFKWTRPFLWKTKSGFCACAITFQTCYTKDLLNINYLLICYIWSPCGNINRSENLHTQFYSASASSYSSLSVTNIKQTNLIWRPLKCLCCGNKTELSRSLPDTSSKTFLQSISTVEHPAFVPFVEPEARIISREVLQCHVVTEIWEVYCTRMRGYNFFNYDCVISVPLRRRTSPDRGHSGQGGFFTC